VLLQTTTWKGPNVPVYSNDSELVGGQSNGRMTPTLSSYSFTGQFTLVPLCLGSLQWCFPIAPTWRSALLWNGTHYVDKKLEFLGFNATEQYNATHWLHFPKCHTKQTQHHHGKGAAWKQHLFPRSTFFNLSVATVVYWSRNASHETNVTGYWTTPKVGPDGGNFQTDIWKLTAARELVNLTSWSLDDLGGGGADEKGL
jgi:hypothetical protein